MNRLLVLDGQQRSSLAITRSLGRAGHNVMVGDAQLPCLSGASRYASTQLRYPDPTRAPRQFQQWLATTVRERDIEIILPATDVTAMLVAPMREQLPGVAFACAEQDAYELVSDKARLVQLALQTGVRVPRTEILLGHAEIQHALREREYPLVLKPARSKILLGEQIHSTAVYIARSHEHALSYLQKQPWLEHVPCLLQEFIPGHGAGVFAFCSKGTPVAWFAHRRLREKPPSGGVSVLSESADVDPRMQADAQRLLTAARWHGIAMVEFRIAADGTPYLMEINARPWGSLQLAIDAGVDFPRLLCASARGGPVDQVPAYRTGIRLRWLLGDVDNLILQLRGTDRSTPAKWRAMRDFCLSFVDLRCRQEIFRWSDPRPALRELRQWIGAVVSAPA